jgi:AraC-like DNA-binding protein
MKIWYHSHQLPKTFTHSHADFEIMYCVSGSYDFHYINPSGIVHMARITPKTMIFIPKCLQHGVQGVEYPYRRYFLDLPVNPTIELLDNPNLLSPFQTSVFNDRGEKEWIPCCLDATKSASTVESIFERMLNVQMLSDIGNSNTELHMRCLLGLLFCELSHNHQEFFTAQHAPNNAMVIKARAYMDEHYDQTVTVGDLAKQHFVHPSYLSHCFTAQMGISPRKYLTNLRLANARKLLESSEDSVQNISLKVGFSDVNNFIQSFRARYGITPRKYRSKMASEIIG